MYSSTQPIIEARGLTKRYGSLTAVDSVDLVVPRGICMGLLGPNGAGKTTTIEMLEGIRAPSAGTILFDGEPLSHRHRDRVGIQFQQTALQEYVTVREMIELFGRLYTRRRPFEELVDMCNLDGLLDRDNRKLSGGQRQRMLLALALVNDPDLVFLDEPTTGLDPQARRNFWALIRKIKAENRTIMLTTHYMEEAESLCDDIAIMDHGVVIAENDPNTLLTEHFHDGVFIRVPNETHREDAFPPNARMYPGYVDIPTGAVDRTVKDLLSHGVSLDGLSVHRPNLDDLFLELTGSSLRE
jgi:ABC-2 type transport system ATP-binding protein